MAKATLRKMKPADHEGVVAMYGAFEPKGEFQGLPPRNRELTMRWLQRLRESGSIEFVIEVNRRIVGHSMLCLEEDKIRAELAIFLHQDYRGRGLGKRLLLGTLNYGCQILKLSRVWLSVQGSNPYALYLFEKVGFRSHGETEPSQWELEMERPSHCEHCREQQCILFGQSLPVTINLPTRRSNTA
jgi:RimJ/RimL family protein N-acetyltransferase